MYEKLNIAQDAAHRPEQQAALLALLRAVQPELDAVVNDFITRFYDELLSQTRFSRVLGLLSESEFAQLRKNQERHLRSLFAGRSAASAHVARHVGRAHALTGIDASWLVDSYGLYTRLLIAHFAGWVDPTERADLLGYFFLRLQEELQWQIEGHEDIGRQLDGALARIDSAILTAHTLSDLLRSVLGALENIEGVVAGTLGRPDAAGVLQFEHAFGSRFKSLYLDRIGADGVAPTLVRGDVAEGLGASGRAWRSRQVQFTASYSSDPAILPWKALAHELGVPSAVSIPILDAFGQPIALMDLYSSYPGFFTNAARKVFIEHLQKILGLAFSRYATSPSGVVPYARRQFYVDLLDHDGLQMLYQPVVSLRTGRPVKLEALARLRRQDGAGMVAPAEFLPVLGAQDMWRLFSLGLEQALHARHRWAQQGVDMDVSVNMPPVALSDPRYVERVEQLLRSHALEPRRLTLELLESGDLDASERRDALLARFRATGVRLAEDDLGSGYSSLLRLDSFPFDEVKIDQGLLGGLGKAPRRALDFIQHLTRLAHDLGSLVVVEGLESPGLVEAAVILQADAGQGYGLARPMPAEAVVDWVRSFHLEIDRDHPRTALGVYAAHLLWEMRLTYMTPWPDALPLAARAATALHNYIAVQGLEGGLLHQAYGRLIAALTEGLETTEFRQAQVEMRRQLDQLVRAELGL
jgi:EAL domain-containing protein (putative c-di-GMP-specific phosphodiesterase class I)